MKNGRDKAVRAKLEQGLALLLENEIRQQTYEISQSNLVERAQQIMNDFLRNEDFFASFCEYISSLRWSTDQKKFIRALYEHGTEFDASFLETNLTPEHLGTLVYELDLPIEYSERSKWHEQTVAKILKAHPELDYRRLQKDAVFAQSAEGKKLATAYQKLCGDISYGMYEHHESSHLVPIPLTKFPFVEAIIVDEVNGYGPTNTYAIGPAPWIEEIWQSDSLKAQEALVARINTRLPRGQRNASDGPSEFQDKGYAISALRRAYEENILGQEAHDQLRTHLLTILDAHTFDGEVAASVRAEDKQARAYQDYPTAEARAVQGIVAETLQSLLTDANAQAREVAETIMNKYAMAQRLEMRIASSEVEGGKSEVLVEKDVLALDKADQKILLVNALNNVTEATDPTVFERIGELAFSPEAAVQLRTLAEERMRILPKLYPPREADRKERDAWWDTHKEEADRLRNDYQHRLNLFLIEELEGMVATGGSPAFKDFVKKISLPEHNIVASEEYQRLVTVGKDTRVSPWDKTTILYANTYENDF